MKKVLLAILFGLIFCLEAFAYTAQTKGSVYQICNWQIGTVYKVLIDGEVLYIQDSVENVQEGDDVIVSIEIDGPFSKPKTKIIYKLQYNDENDPPGM